jgi:hypothetical protein
MKKRSNLAIILFELKRLYGEANLRFCWMSHGPEPLENGLIKLSDGNIYNEQKLADNLSKYEMQYKEFPLQAIKKNYPDW